MTEEKVLQDELLSDEQLEQVAGGNNVENYHDFRFLRTLGLFIEDLDENHESAMKGQLQEHWAKVGVVAIPRTDAGENEYYNSNGKQISRVDAFRIAIKQTKSKLDYKQYL